jgi:hypothetical protein
MRLPSVVVRLTNGEGEVPLADYVRARVADAMDSDEMRRRALAVWRSIDGHTDAPQRETRAKATRLYYVGRDVQDAIGLRAQLHVVHDVVKYLMAIIARSAGIGGFAR